MKKNKATCIILVNYNGYKDTIECVESLFLLKNQSFSIIICDNKSQDHSISHISKWYKNSKWMKQYNALKVFKTIPKSSKIILPKISMIQSNINLGFAGGNNLAAGLALRTKTFDYIWFLNNDTIADNVSLSKLVSFARKAPSNMGIIGSKLFNYYNPRLFQAIGGKISKLTGKPKHIGAGEPDHGQYDDPFLPMDYIVGASMFVSVQTLNRIGLIPDYYFLFYEELDWVSSSRKKGFITGYCPSSKIYHKEGATIGGKVEDEKSYLSKYYSTRSSIIYNYTYNRLFFITVLIYTAGILISKLFRFRLQSCRGMINGTADAFLYILKTCIQKKSWNLD